MGPRATLDVSENSIFSPCQSNHKFTFVRSVIYSLHILHYLAIDWLISNWFWSLSVPMYPGLKNGSFLPHNLIPVQESSVPFLKFQMAPRLKHLMSTGSKEKEFRCACLSEAKASHPQRVWAEVSSSAPHLLNKGLLFSLIKVKKSSQGIMSVIKPITTLDCVLLKEKSLVFEPV